MARSWSVTVAIASALLAPAACSSSARGIAESTQGQAVVATCSTAADCPGYGVANVTCSDWYAPGASECIIDYSSGNAACADGASCYVDACHVGKAACGVDGETTCGGTPVAVPDGEACAGGGECLGGTCTPAGCGSSCVTDGCTLGTIDCEPGLAPVCKSADGAAWAQPNAACPVPGAGPSGVCTFQGENEPFCAFGSAFLITSASSGLGLEVNLTPGVVDTWATASPAGTNSEWLFTGTISSLGAIQNVAAGLCLDSNQSLLPDGAPFEATSGVAVAPKPCLSTSSVDYASLQQWQLVPLADGTYTIVLVGAELTADESLCLDNAGATQNGVVVVTSTCSGAASQKWRIAPVAPVQGCSIGGLSYAPNAVDPANPCESCQPSASPSGWTAQPSNFEVCGASCVDTQSDPTNCGSCGNVCQNVASTGGACTAGQCPVAPAQGCTIDGEVYPAGYVNPTNGCSSCDPSQSTTSWTVSC